MISQFFIGENPNAGIPSFLANLESVAAGKISGSKIIFAFVAAVLNAFHHPLGFSSGLCGIDVASRPIGVNLGFKFNINLALILFNLDDSIKLIIKLQYYFNSDSRRDCYYY